MSDVLETGEIQGLVIRGYGVLDAARFLLVRVRDPEAARQYIVGALDRINRANARAEETALQLAFTRGGLAALGLAEDVLVTFSREFLEGMDDSVRAESLGDVAANAPSTWRWGRGDVHGLVMLYARDEAALATLLERERAELAAGFEIAFDQRTDHLPDHKEHFGWRDGLSMPAMDGVPSHGHRTHPPKDFWTTPALSPGEFVLGYTNEYGVHGETPTVGPAQDPASTLPLALDGVRKDLGRNGTYLVYRQYTQDVKRFWTYLARNAGDPEHAIALGAKMIGRWPNGAPLAVATFDDPSEATTNNFDYAKDRVGLGCPIGAHVRRANPRDDLAPDHQGGDSIAMVRKHQMIRRGRPYGEPLSPTMDPHELLCVPDDQRERGLHFICLVGSINRQFELVQRSWLHSANFHGLFKDGDPLTATRVDGEHENRDFTVPCEPVRKKYKAMEPFTRLVGGAYFFLPSIAALRFIARAPASSSSAPDSRSSGSSSTRPPSR